MPSTIGSYGLAIGFPPRPTGHQHGSTNAGFVFSLVVAIYCHVGCIYHTIKDVSHTINDVSINFGDIVADPIGVAARLVGGVVFTQPNGQRTLPVYPGHIPERSPLAIVVISIDIVGESRSKLVIG
ncbi:MAG: hypothetical protein ABWU13_12625 [Limnospira maxima]